MQEPATFDIHAPAYVPGNLVLTLVPPPEVDLSRCTIRAAVAMTGMCGQILKCSAISPDNCITINFPGLPAGWAFYDIFLTLPGGAEIPLLKGEMDIAPRVTPADPQQRQEWHVTATMPAAETGRVEIILGQGPQGEPGEQGPAGPQGPQGEPGKDGLTEEQLNERYGRLGANNTWDGTQTLKGGVGVGGAIVCYDDYGVQAATVTGVYDNPDQSGLELGGSGGHGFLRILYNSASKYIEILPIVQGYNFCLPILAPISVKGACSADAFQFGPNSISFDSSNPTRVVTSGSWQFGAAAFAGGVTMDQSLNVSGVATMYRCAVYDAAYSLFAVMTGEAVWQNKSSGTFSLRGDDNGLMGVTLTIGRNDREAARVIKQNQNTPLSQTDVPNLAEGDARWVKFNNALTAAQYAALAVKDESTLYITSDTGKIYIGNYSFN